MPEPALELLDVGPAGVCDPETGVCAVPTAIHDHEEDPAMAADADTNKRLAVEYYEMAFNGDVRQAMADYVGPHYIQHHPHITDGPQALIDVVDRMRRENPEMRLHIKRVIAEGDLVFTHSVLDFGPGKPSNALADVFRLEDGKVVEHWDVIEPIPEESVNEREMV